MYKNLNNLTLHKKSTIKQISLRFVNLLFWYLGYVWFSSIGNILYKYLLYQQSRYTEI